MRMGEGRETFNRLLNWDRGQAPSERLAAIILSKEGFKGVDPSHPLGGKDGLKDMVLSFNGKRWIGAVYFPRGQQSFSDIKSKFTHDLSGIDANNANGLAFVTNQEIRLSERKILTEIAPKIDVQIYHLERIASLLNTPSCYGIRMEFLDIEMSKEEQLSFFADNEQRLSRIESTLDQVAISLAGYKVISEPGALKPQSDIADDTLDNGDYEIAPRSMEEVADVAEEFVEKIWFDRHLSLRYRVEQGIENVAPPPNMGGSIEVGGKSNTQIWRRKSWPIQ